MTILWAVLMVPSLIWWKSSITWVVLMSCYALIAAHWSAYQGARAEREAKNGGDEAREPVKVPGGGHG
jgi:hypothetical protein